MTHVAEWCIVCGANTKHVEGKLGGSMCCTGCGWSVGGFVPIATNTSNVPAVYAGKPPPYPDDRALVREQAKRIDRLVKENDRLCDELFLDRVASERKVAFSLFRAEVQDEVLRICEQEPKGRGCFILHNDWDHVMRVMWTKTKLDVRKRCEQRAREIVHLMAEPPKVTP